MKFEVFSNNIFMSNLQDLTSKFTTAFLAELFQVNFNTLFSGNWRFSNNANLPSSWYTTGSDQQGLTQAVHSPSRASTWSSRRTSTRSRTRRAARQGPRRFHPASTGGRKPDPDNQDSPEPVRRDGVKWRDRRLCRRHCRRCLRN